MKSDLEREGRTLKKMTEFKLLIQNHDNSLKQIYKLLLKCNMEMEQIKIA